MTATEEALDILRTVAIAVAITLFVRFFFFQPFNIPSGSMKPTLLVGDFILVDKVEYGYSRASLIWPMTRAPLHGRLLSDTPQTGEIVVFKNSADRNKDYIKRVIGMPGDKVQLISGVVHLNGERAQRELLPDVTPQCAAKGEPNPINARVYRETLPGGQSYIIQECRGDNFNFDNTEVFTVPEGHYFMMGDNRDNSSDSRSHVVGFKPLDGFDERAAQPHFVPLDQIVGKATRVAFSVDGEKAKLWELWNWPGAIRYSRLFDGVE
ncbi:MAG: signal peptidase I [Pseudomonadota bacterium]